MYIVGIDPGKSGGVAFVSIKNPYHDFWALSRTHMTEKDIVDEIGSQAMSISRVFLEKVHSMPKQGVVSAFTFGTDYGFYKGMLAALKLSYVEVTPQTWQKELKCLTKGDKNVSKRKAQQVFPACKKMTHAIADALLIAEYGRIIFK